MQLINPNKLDNDFISIAYAIISGQYDTVLMFLLCLHIITFNMSDEKLEDMQGSNKRRGWSEKVFYVWF